jgi:hypothetical protein
MPLEEGLNMFFDPPMEPQYGKIFSPLHLQMQSELGSSGMYHTMPSYLNNGHSEVQLLYGSNEPDINVAEFLDSILCNPDDENLKNTMSGEDNGSYSRSDAEGINAHVSGTFQDTIY